MLKDGDPLFSSQEEYEAWRRKNPMFGVEEKLTGIGYVLGDIKQILEEEIPGNIESNKEILEGIKNKISSVERNTNIMAGLMILAFLFFLAAKYW